MQDDLRVILIVEDSDEDYTVLTRLLRRLNLRNPLYRCKAGDDCLVYLNDFHTGRKENYPALILLDLNLPGTGGREVLAQIKRHEALRSIPVTVVTTSDDARDVAECYDRGANSYIVKQGDLKAYQQKLNHLVNYWFGAVTLP
jgi:CheY-like chemotaxis protein